MDGYEATRELRRREQLRERSRPVIAMTAAPCRGISSAHRRRMDDYISKPMRYQALVDTLRRWVPALGGVVDHAA